MDELSTYYEVLEIPETASAEEIRSAYIKLAHTYHPDKLGESATGIPWVKKEAEERFRQIHKAWSVLRDTQKRSQYDEQLKTVREEEQSDWEEDTEATSSPNQYSNQQQGPPTQTAATSSSRPSGGATPVATQTAATPIRTPRSSGRIVLLVMVGAALFSLALFVRLAHMGSGNQAATRSVTANKIVINEPVQSKQRNAEGLRILSQASPDFNDAKRAFEQAVQLDSNNIEALNNLGYVYDKLGDYRSAEPILLKVIDLAPTRKVAYGNLGEVQAKLGKTEEASTHFCQYVRLFNSPERGKSLLTRTFNDPDPRVQAAVSSTLANCTSATPANRFATVFDPPTNVRISPSVASGIVCSLDARNTIRILGAEGDWYKTDACDGKIGYINRKQIRF